MLSAGTHLGLNILCKGFLGGSNASVKVSYIPTSNPLALSPINKGK